MTSSKFASWEKEFFDREFLETWAQSWAERAPAFPQREEFLANLKAIPSEKLLKAMLSTRAF